MRRVLALIPVFLLASCSFTCISETRELSVAHVPGTSLRIEAANGRVEVQPMQSADVRIKAEVCARDQERLQAVLVLTTRASDGTLAIEAVWPGGKRKSGEGCSFVVRVPAIGDVSVATSNGSVKIGTSRGAVYVRTSNARIELQDHVGVADVVTSNAGVAIAGQLDRVVARTSNGSVKIRGARGPVELLSSNGSVDLAVEDGFAGVIELSTSNGSVNCDRRAGVTDWEIARSSGRIAFGEGPASRIETSNASITVR